MVTDRTPLNRFVERFVLPLVTGGNLYVEGLIGPAMLHTWVLDPTLDGTLVARITEVSRKRLARLGSVGFADHLELDTLALCAVWHNLLSMTHPDARERRSLRKTVRQWCSAMLEWVTAPTSRAEVSLRHGVFSRLGSVGRVDTHVTFWAGYADFVGVPPPRALVALPTLRRVHETRNRVDLFGLLSALELPQPEDPDADLFDVVRTALAYSPLTDLSLAERPAPMGFSWTPPTLNALSDRAVRGAAQRALLSRGTPAIRAIEHATLERSRIGLPPDAARVLALFHLELLVMDALSSRPSEGQRATSVPQPFGLDVFLRLGHERAATLVGVPVETVTRALLLDPNRPIAKDPPSAALLACAGLLEVRP